MIWSKVLWDIECDYSMHPHPLKNIFGITNLIYFWDIWKMHPLNSEKIYFSMVICCKCLEHSVVFPVDLFWSNLHLTFPLIPFSWNSRVWSFFSFILGTETFFLEGFKVFCIVLLKDKSSQVIKVFFIFQLLQMLLFFEYCTSHILINIITSNLM